MNAREHRDVNVGWGLGLSGGGAMAQIGRKGPGNPGSGEDSGAVRGGERAIGGSNDGGRRNVANRIAKAKAKIAGAITRLLTVAPVLLLLFVLGANASAQQVSFGAIAPPGPTSVGASAFGARGGTILYYWVIARYPGGASTATMAQAFSTVGGGNLTGSNFVRVSWAPAAGATGYDVLRSDLPQFPGPCSACAVSLNTASTSVDDTGGALSAYPPGGLNSAVPVNAFLTVNNRDEATPYVNLQLLSIRLNELLRVALISGTPAENDCMKWASGRLVSAGAPCGSGGGSGGYSTIQNDGVSQTQRDTLNLQSSSTVNVLCGDGTTKTNCQVAADTAVVQTKASTQSGAVLACVSTTGNDSYECLLDPTLTAYTDGQVLRLKGNATSSGAASLKVDGLAVVAIKRCDGTTDPANGDITSGDWRELTFVDAATDYFRLPCNPQTVSSSSTISVPFAPYGYSFNENGTTPTRTALLVRYIEILVPYPILVDRIGANTAGTGGYAGFALYSADCSALIAQTATVNTSAHTGTEFAFASQQILPAGKYVLADASETGNTIFRTAGLESGGSQSVLVNIGRSSSTYGIFTVSGGNASATFSSPNLTFPSACSGTRSTANGNIAWVIFQ